MMNFEIRFIDRSCDIKHIIDVPRPAAKGEITIGGFSESFYSTLEVWQCSDYERQWQDALGRLKSGLNSCFIVCVHPPSIARFLECWIFWRLETEYRIQNQSMFFDDLGEVDPRNPYDAIWPYRNVTEDGEQVSDDWGLPVETFS